LYVGFVVFVIYPS